MERFLHIYRRLDGRAPYEEWIDHLRDVVGRAKIRVRLDRMRQGNFGQHRSLGAGLLELKIDYGPGYRVYVGLSGEQVVVILAGGDKSTQQKDIFRAFVYWTDYEKRL